ncbi:zinc-binding dehydrogenase [Amorphoplanes digitatis]|uniref:Threonine dehydrogenase-like Zn-dependent dehydrogenase n=1 Tax=Actinoplanes digitatis TaxID=1868 RepID=A0A7W7MS93_9ACTN|nr:zinc-binding dehydrogenase [Actinoplanes digitatis]MBB4765098.1 threonine dehydrogenase-like Zn-dependent dehydrogenase [Actinoplanes digitatis]
MSFHRFHFLCRRWAASVGLTLPFLSHDLLGGVTLGVVGSSMVSSAGRTEQMMAEYTVVPRNQVHHLPDGVPLELGALVEPMSVAYHAATLAEVNDQSSALVYGAGPIGIGIWFALRGMGLTEIDVVEPTETRRRSIEALGARTLDPTTQDVPGIIAERSGGDGVDAAFDAAGVAPAIQSALDSLGERRALISVAIYEKPLVTPLINLVLRERRIQGTICYTGDDYRAVIDLMARGHYDTTGWVDTVPSRAL